MRRAIVSALVGFGLVVTSGLPASAATMGSGEKQTPAAVIEGPSDEQLIASATQTAAAQAVDTGEVVEVAIATTPTDRLLAQPDGTIQLETSTVPVRAERAEGDWVPINTDLVLRDGWWEPEASATPVRFSAGGTNELDEIRTPGGEWLTETWPHGALPAPTIDGRTATYPEVFPDVDLKLTATELGMASVYVVKTAEAASNPDLAELKVELEGAEITREQTGAFTAETEAGDTITAAHPLWWDSSDGGSADGPGDSAPVMPVEHALEESSIALDVTETVEGESPTYPIFIDPDWNTGPNAAWYTDAAYPNVSYLSAGVSDVLRMGRFSNMHGNAFFEFNISALAGKQILGAQLSMTQVAVAASPNNPVQLRPFGHQNAGFTWNQQNHSLWGGVIGTQSPGYWGGPAVAVGWDVGGAIAARVGQTWAQFGLAPQDENAQSRRHFSRAATLTVNYNSPPNAPTDPQFVTPSTSCGTASAPRYISATSVVVSVHQTDPDPENVDVNFSLYRANDLNNRIQWRAPGLGAQGTKTVTFTDLIDGQAYAWNARGSDWKIDGNGSTSWCYFTIDRTGPSAPTFTGPSTPPTVGVASTMKINTVPADRVAFIAYTMQPGAGSSSFVFPYFGSAPPCGTVQGQVRIACPNTSGVATVSVVPTDSVSSFLAVPYDVAGNPGVIAGTPAGQPGTVGASFQVNAANHPAVSFDAGHGWLTQIQSSPLGANIPDSNATAPVPLTLGMDTFRTKTANPRSPSIPIQKPVLEFSSTPVGLIQYYAYGAAPAGATQWLSPQSTGAGSQAVYECVGTVGSTTTWAIGTEALCYSRLNSPSLSLVGYTWGSSGGDPSLVPVGECYRGGWEGFDVATYAQCQPANWRGGDFGYVLQLATNSLSWTKTSAPVLSPTSSFTVASWLKPASGGASAAVSTDTSTAGFELGATASQWQFCLRPAGSNPVCASAPRAANADWTHLSGIWDAGNGQIRLYIRGSLAASTSFTWPAGTATTSRAINVGAAVSAGSASARWTGMIADPAVFAGVATGAQLGSLADGNDPAYG